MIGNLEIEKITPHPIYRQIADIMKAKIVSGEWANGTKLPSEPELAQQFGTSHITLRKGLKILQGQKLLIQQKGRGTFITFCPAKKFKIAVTLTLTQDSYILSVFAGLVKALQMDSDNEIILLDHKNTSSILQKFHDSGCDGIIAVSPNLSTIEKLCRPEFDEVPIVFFHASEGRLSGKNKTCVDIAKGSILLGMERLAKLGHKRVAFFAPEPYNMTFQPIVEGYRKNMDAYGFSTDEKYFNIITNTDSWHESTRKRTVELCSLPDRPTAIICSGRTFAYGAWQGIMESGLKVPDDISILGFDCEKNVNPRLSAIVEPFPEMAHKAGELMLARLDGRDSCSSIFFNAVFEERGSCSIVPEAKR